MEKLKMLSVDTRIQNVIFRHRGGSQSAATCKKPTIVNTGSPQGYILSPSLFTLLTHDRLAGFTSNFILKFACDTTVDSLISSEV